MSFTVQLTFQLLSSPTPGSSTALLSFLTLDLDNCLSVTVFSVCVNWQFNCFHGFDVCVLAYKLTIQPSMGFKSETKNVLAAFSASADISLAFRVQASTHVSVAHISYT